MREYICGKCGKESSAANHFLPLYCWDCTQKLGDIRFGIVKNRGEITRPDVGYCAEIVSEALGGAEYELGHRFYYLRGDPTPHHPDGVTLPVSVFYPSQNLVLEFRDDDNCETAESPIRNEQRVRYDKKMEKILPAHDVKLLFIYGHQLLGDHDADLYYVRQVMEWLLHKGEHVRNPCEVYNAPYDTAWNPVGELCGTPYLRCDEDDDSQWKSLLTQAEKDTELNPHDLDAWVWRYRALEILDRLEEAKAVLEQTIELFPKDASIRFDQFMMERHHGHHKAAIAALDKTLELDPQYALAWDAKGRYFMTRQRYEDALSAFNKALEISSDQYTLRNKAFALGKLGRYEEAYKVLKKAVDMKILSRREIYKKRKGNMMILCNAKLY